MAKLSVLNEDLAEMMLRMDDSRLEDARLEDARCLTTTLSKNKKIINKNNNKNTTKKFISLVLLLIFKILVLFLEIKYFSKPRFLIIFSIFGEGLF